MKTLDEKRIIHPPDLLDLPCFHPFKGVCTMDGITRCKSPRNWTRQRINRELRARGLKQSDLVERLGRAQSLISEVIGGRMSSLVVATAIAAELGTSPDVIWPRRYDRLPSEEPMTEPMDGPAPIDLAS